MNKNSASDISLNQDVRNSISAALDTYFKKELEVEVTHLQLELFMDFLDQEIAKNYYNAGVLAAMNAMRDKTEDLVLLLKEK